NVRLEAVDDVAIVRMTVSNDGDPISEPNREKIFDAFFTTRRDTGGTGMGLAIVQAIMASHGGSIRLIPSEKGVTFALQFPAAQSRFRAESLPVRAKKTRQKIRP
ncbi:ATP-binding protein, partial [Acinetobacter baumannii]|uniref:ATP-binding protein n=1 Tax=Acinetobacter baumannii TaxID=470 RepID=UPI001111F372